jgi:hypothetical protein
MLLLSLPRLPICRPLPLLHPRFAIGLQFPGLRLLLRRQKREDLALHPRPLDGELGLGFDQRLRRGADQPFVEGDGIHGFSLRLHGGAKLLRQCAVLLRVVLGSLADLLLLRLAEVQFAKGQPSAGATSAGRSTWTTRATATESGALRESDAAREQGRERCGRCERTKSRHGNLHILQIAEFRLQIGVRYANVPDLCKRLDCIQVADARQICDKYMFRALEP